MVIVRPNISVIIPCYNAETTLYRCLESVSKQNFKNYEVLIIDDGSTDSSGKICDAFALKDERINVFHRKNGGVASARNVGVREAKGRYSIHVDADDWIEPNMLQDMYEEIQKSGADVLFADFYKNNLNREVYVEQVALSSGRECIKGILTGALMGSMWNKLIKHDLYSQYSLRFPDGINYSEDAVTIIRLLLHTDNIAYLNKPYYHYSYNPSSITVQPTQKHLEQLVSYHLYLDGILQQDPLFHSALIFAKIQTKAVLLLNRAYSRKEYLCIFPETNDYILRFEYSKIRKISLWCAIHHLWYVSTTIAMLYRIRRKLLLFIFRFKKGK